MKTILLFGRAEEVFNQELMQFPVSWESSASTKKGDRGLLYLIETGILYEWRAVEKGYENNEWVQKDKKWEYAADWEPVRTFSSPLTCAEMKRAFTFDEWPSVHQNLHYFPPREGHLILADHVVKKLMPMLDKL